MKIRLIKIIENFSNLEQGWDGDPTSIKPNDNIISIAKIFLDTIPENYILPTVSVCGNGEINFLWTDFVKKHNIRISFLEPNCIGYSYKLSTTRHLTVVALDNVSEILNAIREFSFS